MKHVLFHLVDAFVSGETCICKEAFFSKLGSEVTPCHPNRVKPCVCKLITSPKCSHCCSHEHAHDDHADSSEQSSDKREQLLSESSLQYLWYKMKTACKTFQRKSVGEILEDREFQLICKKWARDMCMEEYKNEEKRVRIFFCISKLSEKLMNDIGILIRNDGIVKLKWS